MHYECSTMSPVTRNRLDQESYCPVKLTNNSTRQASLKAEHWARCERRGCPLQDYTSNRELNQRLQKMANVGGMQDFNYLFTNDME